MVITIITTGNAGNYGNYLRFLGVFVGMGVISWLLGLFGRSVRGGNLVAAQVVYEQQNTQNFVLKSVWDFLRFREHTQAHYCCVVIGFEEWVTMEEIRRRVKELFGVEYKNDRSLYPYLKALVDVGLLETIKTDGKMKWRKRDLLVKVVEEKKQEERERVAAEAKAKAVS